MRLRAHAAWCVPARLPRARVSTCALSVCTRALTPLRPCVHPLAPQGAMDRPSNLPSVAFRGHAPATDHLVRTAMACADAAAAASAGLHKAAMRSVCSVARRLRTILYVFKPLMVTSPNSTGLYGCPHTLAVVGHTVVTVITAALAAARSSDEDAVVAAVFAQETRSSATKCGAMMPPASDPVESHSPQDTQSLLDAKYMVDAIIRTHDLDIDTDIKEQRAQLLGAKRDLSEAKAVFLANALDMAQERVRVAKQQREDATDVLRSLTADVARTSEVVASTKGRAALATAALQAHIHDLATEYYEANDTQKRAHDRANGATRMIQSDDDMCLRARAADTCLAICRVQTCTAFNALVVAANTLNDLGCVDMFTLPREDYDMLVSATGRSISPDLM